MFQQLAVRITESWWKKQIVLAFKVRLNSSYSSIRFASLSQDARLAVGATH